MEIGVLVADSGAFIKNAPLQAWSRDVVTVREALGEIRDKATRERLQVLPYQLTLREPTTDALHHVTQFSKKTGDYGSLSPVDLKLLALTYQLHCELHPTSYSQLRTCPPQEQAANNKSDFLNTVGFYNPHKKHSTTSSSCPSFSSSPSTDRGGGDEVLSDEKRGKNTSEIREEEELQGNKEEEEEDEGLLSNKMGQLSVTDDGKEEEMRGEGEGEGEGERGVSNENHEEEDCDEDGWITPDNFQQACEEMGGVLEEAPQSLAVGCVTTDFAMQNILLQMGLNLISVDGMRIRQLKTYAKKCKGCFKTTTSTGLVFCPWCGNHSLYKVSVVVYAQGTLQYKPLSQKQFSHKGLKYPLPMPKTGRHCHNPILSPDQQVTYRERRRRENKVDALDRDYVALSSPFTVHDVNSRGARIAMATSKVTSHRCKNPNAVRPKGRRK